MKLHEITHQVPTPVSAVTFVPWPFRDNMAHLNMSALYWNGEQLRRPVGDVPWRLYEGSIDNTLVTFSDGSVAVCDEAQVADVIAYVAANGIPG